MLGHATSADGSTRSSGLTSDDEGARRAPLPPAGLSGTYVSEAAIAPAAVGESAEWRGAACAAGEGARSHAWGPPGAHTCIPSHNADTCGPSRGRAQRLRWRTRVATAEAVGESTQRSADSMPPASSAASDISDEGGHAHEGSSRKASDTEALIPPPVSPARVGDGRGSRVYGSNQVSMQGSRVMRGLLQEPGSDEEQQEAVLHRLPARDAAGRSTQHRAWEPPTPISTHDHEAGGCGRVRTEGPARAHKGASYCCCVEPTLPYTLLCLTGLPGPLTSLAGKGDTQCRR